MAYLSNEPKWSFEFQQVTAQQNKIRKEQVIMGINLCP